MLGIGMQEIIIILIVALIVIGPKKLPDLAKALGRAMGEFRKAANDLKENLDIDGVKEEKEKFIREFTQPTLSKDTKPSKDKESVTTQKPKEEMKDPDLNG
jgi:TatA/E family protein of Tat protein translocase